MLAFEVVNRVAEAARSLAANLAAFQSDAESGRSDASRRFTT
jgi:hypothetical protein